MGFFLLKVGPPPGKFFWIRACISSTSTYDSGLTPHNSVLINKRKIHVIIQLQLDINCFIKMHHLDHSFYNVSELGMHLHTVVHTCTVHILKCK